MTEHKHSGLDSYMTNPGHVTEASGLQVEKDEHAPDSKIKRNPVIPQPAIPMLNGRPVPSLDLGPRSLMNPASVAIKFPEPEKTENDNSGPQEG